MNTHRITLLASREVARGTMAFRFSKPAGFTFRAGQAIDLILPAAAAGNEGAKDAGGAGDAAGDGASDEGSRHAFSIASAPHEDELVIATRMRGSRFKRRLAALPPGAEATLEGPFGSLTLPLKPRRALVWVAGGIGITPFRSMWRALDHGGSKHAVTLLYSNRRPEDAAFLGELDALAARLKAFNFVPTMTGADAGAAGVAWPGHTRRLDDEDFIRAVIPDPQAAVYSLAGPPAMVEAVRAALERLGVNEDDVRAEAFHGY